MAQFYCWPLYMRAIGNEEKGAEAILLSKIERLEIVNRAILHNLRGGISNIQMLSQLMREPTENANNGDRCKGLPVSDAAKYIEEISGNLLKCMDSFTDVVSMPSAEEIRYEECDIAATIDRIMAQLRGSVYEKTPCISVSLDIKRISYPAAYLESILYNLISNSLKYSRSDVPLKINIKTYLLDDKMVLEVRDNGLGIDLEKYGHKIFKINQTFHKGYDSQGMGLYLIKSQIESLGGTITVKSKEHEGSGFMAYLV